MNQILHMYSFYICSSRLVFNFLKIIFTLQHSCLTLLLSSICISNKLLCQIFACLMFDLLNGGQCWIESFKTLGSLLKFLVMALSHKTKNVYLSFRLTHCLEQREADYLGRFWVQEPHLCVFLLAGRGGDSHSYGGKQSIRGRTRRRVPSCGLSLFGGKNRR